MSKLAKFAAERGVKYFMISYTDLFGAQRAKLVPAAAIGDAEKDGAGFAGFATWLDLTPAHPDLFAIPDASAVWQLPWKPEFAWVAADCWMDEKPLAQAPRLVLKGLVEKAKALGLRVKTGVEPEFFLITPDGAKISDPFDVADKPCYDQQALLRRADVIADLDVRPVIGPDRKGAVKHELHVPGSGSLHARSRYLFRKFSGRNDLFR